MALVLINGEVYEEEVSRLPVSLVEEEKKLEWMQGAIANDEREEAEYLAIAAEIDATDLPEDVKKSAKASKLYSPSGVTQEEADRQRVYVEQIKALKETKKK